MKKSLTLTALILCGSLFAATDAELKAIVDPNGVCSEMTFNNTGTWSIGNQSYYGNYIQWSTTSVTSGTELISFKYAADRKTRFYFENWNYSLRIKVDGNYSGYSYENNYISAGTHTIAICFPYNSSGNVDPYVFEFNFETEPSSFAVKFEPCGGTCSTSSRTYNSGSAYGTLPSATLNGCTHTGWGKNYYDSSVVTSTDTVSYWERTLYAKYAVDNSVQFLDPSNVFNWNFPQTGTVTLNYTSNGYYDEESGEYVNSYSPYLYWYGSASMPAYGEKILLSGSVSGCGKVIISDYFYAYPNKRMLIDGNEMTSAEYMNADNEFKLIRGGTHSIAISVTNTSSYSWSTPNLQIGRTVWEPAPSSVKITFMSDDKKFMSGDFTPGQKYGTFYDPPDQSGKTFLGWFTAKYGGTKVESSDYVDWDQTTLYAHWEQSIQDALGTSVYNVKVSDSGLWKGDNGVALTPASATSSESRKYWMEADCDGEAIISFDLSMYAMATNSYANGNYSFRFYVDGVETEYNGKLDAQTSVSGSGSCYSYDNGHYCYYNLNRSGSTAESVCTYKAYLSAGKHTLRWEISTSYCYGAETVIVVDDFKKEQIEDITTIYDWGNLLYTYKAWRENNLASIQSGYAEKKANTEAGWKAAVEHAVTTLAMLGEDPLVANTCKQFGYDLDYGKMDAIGSLNFDKAPDSNTLTDNAFAKIKSAAETAISDLDFVIDNIGSGFLTIPADEYDLDASIKVDKGDVLYVKSSLEMALAAVYWVKAYNVEVDYAQLKSDMINPVITKVANAPTIDATLWNAINPVEMDYDSRVASVKAAINGDNLYILIKKGAGFPDSSISSYGSWYANCGVRLAKNLWPDVGHVEFGAWISSNWSIASGYNNISCNGWYQNNYAPTSDYVSADENDDAIMIRYNCDWCGLGSAEDYQHLDLIRIYLNANYEQNNVGYTGFWKQYQFADSGRQYRAFDNQKKLADKVRDTSALAKSKDYLKAALNLALMADNYIWNDRASGTFLVNYDAIDFSKSQHNEVKNAVNRALASLDSAQEYDYIDNALNERKESVGLDNPLTIYLGALISGNVKRSLLPPSLSNSEYLIDLEHIPDATFGGLFPTMTVAKWQSFADFHGYNPNGYTIRFDRGIAPMVYPEETMDDLKCSLGRVYKLPKCTYNYSGHRFKGWRSSLNDRLYDDCILIFNLTSETDKVITFTAEWEAK